LNQRANTKDGSFGKWTPALVEFKTIKIIFFLRLNLTQGESPIFDGGEGWGGREGEAEEEVGGGTLELQN